MPRKKITRLQMSHLKKTVGSLIENTKKKGKGTKVTKNQPTRRRKTR